LSLKDFFRNIEKPFAKIMEMIIITRARIYGKILSASIIPIDFVKISKI